MNNILVISSPDLTDGLRSVLERQMRELGIPTMQLRVITHLTRGFVETVGKRKKRVIARRRDEFLQILAHEMQRYQARTLVINDWIALEYLIQKNFQESGLGLTRGAVYMFNGVPAIVLDSMRTREGGARLHVVPHALWVMQQDLKKVKRWYNGEQRYEPTIDYRVIQSVKDVQNYIRKSAMRFSWLVMWKQPDVGHTLLLAAQDMRGLQRMEELYQQVYHSLILSVVQAGGPTRSLPIFYRSSDSCINQMYRRCYRTVPMTRITILNTIFHYAIGFSIRQLASILSGQKSQSVSILLRLSVPIFIGIGKTRVNRMKRMIQRIRDCRQLKKDGSGIYGTMH